MSLGSQEANDWWNGLELATKEAIRKRVTNELKSRYTLTAVGRVEVADKTPEAFIIYTDGAPDRTALYIPRFSELKEFNLEGPVSNNQSEYIAIIRALEYIISQPIAIESEKNFVIRADSQLAIYQINGIYKCKEQGLRRLLEEVNQLIDRVKSRNAVIKFEWVKRNQNPAGIALE